MLCKVRWMGLWLGIFLLSGCGYAMVGQSSLPPHIKTIAIPIFVNKTLEEGVEDRLTNAVINEFVNQGGLKLVSETKADAVLAGTVMSYKNKEAVAYDDQNEVSKYRVTITVNVELKDQIENKVLWKNDGLTEDFDYDGGPNVSATEELDNEKQAVNDLADELAQKIRILSTEGF